MVQKAGASWTGPRLSGGVLTCVCGLVSGSRMEKGLAFSCSLFVSLFVLDASSCSFLGMLPFPRTAGHMGHWSREHPRKQIERLHCAALLGLAASLAPSPVIYPFSDAPLHVYVAVPTATNALVFFIDRWSQILAAVLPILSLAVCSSI